MMKPYADELQAIMDAIINVMLDGGDENRRSAVFQALLAQVEAEHYPDSVKTLCAQAEGAWTMAQTLTDSADKAVLQRSAMLYLLAAFGRISGLATIEEYIIQRNNDVFGLR